MQGLFVFQSVLSSVGQHLVDPDCELSIFTPAAAFYRKNIMYACFPLLAVVLPWVFWWLMSRVACCSKDRGWRGRSGVFEKKNNHHQGNHQGNNQGNNQSNNQGNNHENNDEPDDEGQANRTTRKKTFSNKDKAILSTVVGLYLLYPTTTLQTFSLLSCKEVGRGFWLTADLEEPCYEGRHLMFFFVLVVPQLLAYIVGLPALSFYFMWRNR